eukprot:gene11773-24687_t
MDFTIENILKEFGRLKSIDFDTLLSCNISGHFYLGVPVILSPVLGKSVSPQVFIATSFRADSGMIVLKCCIISSSLDNVSTNQKMFETADPIVVHFSIFQRNAVTIPVSALSKLAQKLQGSGLHLQIPSWSNEAINYIGKTNQTFSQLTIEFKDRIDGLISNENRCIVYSNIFELDNTCQSVTLSQSIPIGYLIEQQHNNQVNGKLSYTFIDGLSSGTDEGTSSATNDSIGLYTKSQIATKIHEAEVEMDTAAKERNFTLAQTLAETIQTLKDSPVKVPSAALPNAVEIARKSKRVWENTLEKTSTRLEHQSAVTRAMVGGIISLAATLGVRNLFISGSRIFMDNQSMLYRKFDLEIPDKLNAVRAQILPIKDILLKISNDTEVLVKEFIARPKETRQAQSLPEIFLRFIRQVDVHMKWKKQYYLPESHLQVNCTKFCELGSRLGEVAVVELWMSMGRAQYSKLLGDAVIQQKLLEFLVSLEWEEIITASRQLGNNYGLCTLSWSLSKAGYAATVAHSEDKTELGVKVDLWEPSFGNTAGHDEYLLFMKDRVKFGVMRRDVVLFDYLFLHFHDGTLDIITPHKFSPNATGHNLHPENLIHTFFQRSYFRLRQIIHQPQSPLLSTLSLPVSLAHYPYRSP